MLTYAKTATQSTATQSLLLQALSISALDGRRLLHTAEASFHPLPTALTGPNGSGKSTLLRAIAALHPIDAGSISLVGLHPGRDRAAYLAQLVFMPQNFPVYPSMTGQEFLEYGLLLRGASRNNARSTASAWLNAVGLHSVAKAQAGTYSQGMRQRLGFAYALQLDLPLYLLDEPFAGVDPEWRSAMLDLLFNFCADRIAIVSTHHADEMLARGADEIRLVRGQLESAW